MRGARRVTINFFSQTQRRDRQSRKRARRSELPKGPPLEALRPITHRTVLRATRSPATSRLPAPSAMGEAPPVGRSMRSCTN